MAFCNAIQSAMQEKGIEVNCISSKETAFENFAKNEYCLVIISLQSSTNHDDIEILRMMREMKSIPILALAKALSIYEKIQVFYAGANVCLEQPVNLDLCVAQAHSLIQLYLDAREEKRDSFPLVFNMELIINPVYRHVIIDGEPLALTRTEFDLLYYMAKHANQIFSRQQLYRQVWGDDLGVNGENTVHTHIGNLYKKLADVGKNYIQNIRGVGYKFVPPAGKE